MDIGQISLELLDMAHDAHQSKSMLNIISFIHKQKDTTYS